MNSRVQDLHPGFQLEPDDYQVLQWPIRWLHANEPLHALAAIRRNPYRTSGGVIRVVDG